MIAFLINALGSFLSYSALFSRKKSIYIEHRSWLYSGETGVRRIKSDVGASFDSCYFYKECFIDDKPLNWLIQTAGEQQQLDVRLERTHISTRLCRYSRAIENLIWYGINAQKRSILFLHSALLPIICLM